MHSETQVLATCIGEERGAAQIDDARPSYFSLQDVVNNYNLSLLVQYGEPSRS
jgi:hypothetical protein